MQKWFLIFLFSAISGITKAQSSDEMLKNARQFTMQGDLENAILILKNGLDQYPNDTQLRQELSMAYFAANRAPQALETIKPLLNANKPEETVYQVGGLIYRSLSLNKDAEKLYKEGLKNYPNSGVLHNEYGQMLESLDPGRGEGIKMWEKGIELAPGYAGNYYQASRYYAIMNNTLWSLLYGEIFVNLDSYSNRTIEIKNILYQNYKKVFAYGFAGLNDKNPFEKAVSETLVAQKSVISAGVTPETLAAIRTRFILDWYYKEEGKKYPFALFSRFQNMIREGLFDAYNQWLFGGVANMSAFQIFTQTHETEYKGFSTFQQQKLFIIPAGQFYK